MKKIISVILALSMVVTTMAAIAITSSANGTWSGESTFYGVTENSHDEVEALYFETAPTIDGYVTEAEWGERTVELYSFECATSESRGEELFASFFYWKSGDPNYHPMEAMFWLRWDEDYFYLAAIVRDYNGHSLKHGKDETWDGDALEFRIDEEGPNAAHGGWYDREMGSPWSEESIVPDFVVGYVQVAGGFSECYDRTNDKSLTAYSEPVLGSVLVAVAPSEQNSDNPLNYHQDAKDGYTTYEVAIPWKYIYENEFGAFPESTLTDNWKAPCQLTYTEYHSKKNVYGGIGKELGMSIMVLGASKGSHSFEEFMCWGSGLSSQYQCQEVILDDNHGYIYNPDAHINCSGSNCVTLVADKVEQDTYEIYDSSVLEGNMSVAVYDDVFYDYLGGDIYETNPLDDARSLTTLTYDDPTDMEYWGSPTLYQGSTIDVGGDHGMVLNYDRALHDYYTYVDGNEVLWHAGIAPIDNFYISTEIDFGIAYTYPLSFTYEMDVMYTGLEKVEPGYPSSLGNWFGGADAVEYYCGYSFNDKAFVVCDALSCGSGDYIAMSEPYDLDVNTWYNWKFQYDNDTCTLRLYINDELVLETSNRYFYYSSEQHLTDGTMMIMWYINTQLKMDNVKMYNFYDYEANATVSNTIRGNVTVHDDDEPTDAPVVVNIYNDGSDEIYSSVSIDGDGGEYVFEDLPDGEYMVEVTKDGFVSDGYKVGLVDGATYNAVNNIYQYGDVDRDGSLCAMDALCIKQIIVRIREGGSYYDLNNDGRVNAKDLRIIVSLISQ